MSPLGLTLAYLRRDAPAAALSVVLLAVGIATVTVLLLLTHQLQDRLTRDAEGIDLVVGAKGSPMQLILAGIFHLDAPTGNIPLEEARWVADHPLVAETIPLALGDSFRGARIVGTEHAYVEHYGGELAEGRLWESDMEAVLGARMAERAGLETGDRFVGVHGITAADDGAGEVHDDRPYTITGVLAPTGTVLDRLVLVSVESVWHVHDHDGDTAPGDGDDHGHDSGEARDTAHADDRELTMQLVSYRSPLAAVTLPRAVNERGPLQAASPSRQIQRLMGLLGFGFDALRTLGWLLVGLATLGVFIGLYSAMRHRRRDLALLRLLGASRARLFGQTLFEGVALTLAGTLLGLCLGHVAAELLGQGLRPTEQLAITGRVFVMEELWLLLLALPVGAAAALVPAIQAYRTDVAETLGRGS